MSFLGKCGSLSIPLEELLSNPNVLHQVGERHNEALHLTPENVAKIHEYNHLFRVEGMVQGRGAQVRFIVGPLNARTKLVEANEAAISCGSGQLTPKAVMNSAGSSNTQGTVK